MLQLIDVLHNEGSMSVTELSEHTDLGASTVHKYLKTLEQEGYLKNDDGTYSLTLKFLDIGGRVRANNPLYKSVLQKLGQLDHESDWLITFALREGTQAVMVYGGGSGYNMHPTYLGRHFHLHANSLGKAILGELPDEEIKEIVEVEGLPSFTQDTITDEDELWAEIERIRERGYAINRGERNSEIWGVSTSIMHPRDDTVGSVSLAGAAHRFMSINLDSEVVPRVLEIKDELNLSFRSD